MAKKWEFMKADSVYIYPSANADDGGDVNSEVNISGISEHLIQKDGFIICKPGQDPKPLYVYKTVNSAGQHAIRVSGGSIILDGYYLDLYSKQSKYLVIDQVIDSSFIEDPSAFLTEYNRIYNQDYQKDSSGKIVPKKRSKKANPPEELPMIHFVIKLIKDITGNVRGDLLERSASGSTTLMCKGCCWTFMTTEEMRALTVPYLDVAQFLIEPGNTSVPFVINQVINPPSNYAYIYIDSIFDENGDILSESIENKIKDATQSLPKITHYTYDDPSDPDSPRYKDLEISVENGIPKVIRYVKKDPEEFDENGDYVVVPVSGDSPYELIDSQYNFEKTYSIDDIQKRTHPSSRQGYTPQTSIENAIADVIEIRDTGEGQIGAGTEITEGPVNNYTNRQVKTLTNNGYSRLIARADHDHDLRYLMNSIAKPAGNQSITDLLIKKKLSVNLKFDIAENGDITNPILSTQTGTSNDPGNRVNIKGTINIDQGYGQNNKAIDTQGDIYAGRVFNAVWNDYAELYEKADLSEEIPSGSVICKVPGKNTYASSEYSNRKLVVGVCSDSYGHLLGGDPNLSLEENLQKYIPIALSGRVYVNVIKDKPIYEGDMLVVSQEKGKATSVAYPEPGTIIGKALENTDGTKDRILMQIMLG